MAQAPAWRRNPILEALVDDVAGHVGDVDAVQRRLELVRAEVAENAALYADAAARLAQARRRLARAAVDAALRMQTRDAEQELDLEDDPEVAASAAAYVEVAARAQSILQHEVMLLQAVWFLIFVRALFFALNRAHLLPGVLATVVAAYALAYAASWGAVVPGPASLMRISVLLLCFLFGIPVVGNLA